jgi:surface antigen
MIRKQFVAPLLAVPLLFACESYTPTSEEFSRATGAILGGVIGHQFGGGHGKTVATIGGAALGAFVGSRVGRTMDRNDQLKTAQALESSRDGQATTWRNAGSGQQYSVTPTRTYGETPTRTYGASSGQCRDFTTVTEIEGRQEVVRGFACKQPDGTWKVS